MILGYSSRRAAKNIIHAIIGRADPDITIAAAGLRTGTLEALFLNLAAAVELETLLAGANVLELADTDYPALNMSYVASGAIEVSLDDQTRTRWVVRFDYQEITP